MKKLLLVPVCAMFALAACTPADTTNQGASSSSDSSVVSIDLGTSSSSMDATT